MAEEALALARSRGDEAVVAYALTMFAQSVSGEDGTRAIAREIADIADRLRGQPVRYGPTLPDSLAGEAADNMAGYFTYRDVREAIRWERLALEYAERGHDRRLMARHLGLLAWLHVMRGDLGAAVEAAAQARSLLLAVGGGRWDDVVALSEANVLQLRGDDAAAEATIRDMIDSGLATGRLLFVHYGSHDLVDMLVDRGDLVEADAVLSRAEKLLEGLDAPKFVGALQVRRARLLRLAGRTDEASAKLAATEQYLEDEALSPQLMIWLVEHALLADDPAEARAWVDRLEDLSRRTGVAIPPWERRLLAGLELRT
jgi:ATP/maltotriose-dependent transcriptional regulator MalT